VSRSLGQARVRPQEPPRRPFKHRDPASPPPVVAQSALPAPAHPGSGYSSSGESLRLGVNRVGVAASPMGSSRGRQKPPETSEDAMAGPPRLSYPGRPRPLLGWYNLHPQLHPAGRTIRKARAPTWTFLIQVLRRGEGFGFEPRAAITARGRARTPWPASQGGNMRYAPGHFGGETTCWFGLAPPPVFWSMWTDVAIDGGSCPRICSIMGASFEASPGLG
jgi:hypothetical protein